MVKAVQLVRVHPRTFRVAGVPKTWESDVAAAILSLDGWVAGLRTAARLWELDGCCSQVIELIGEGRSPSRRRGVILHETDALPIAHRATVTGIPTTDIVRTLIELGRVSSADTVEGALECAVRRGFASFDYVMRKLTDFRGPGRRGCLVLDEVFRRRSGKPTASWLETKLCQVLRRGGLPPPLRQIPVYDDDGVFIARPDFLYPDAKLAIEGLSLKHHSGLRDVDADALRRNRLIAAGYRVLEITNRHLDETPDLVCAQVAEALGARLS